MEKDPYFNTPVSAPAKLKLLLIDTPNMVRKQTQSYAILLCSTFTLTLLNFVAYFYYQGTQIEKATIETYIDFTQTPIYP